MQPIDVYLWFFFLPIVLGTGATLVWMVRKEEAAARQGQPGAK